MKQREVKSLVHSHMLVIPRENPILVCMYSHACANMCECMCVCVHVSEGQKTILSIVEDPSTL